MITEITFDLKRNIENLIHMYYDIFDLKINVNLLKNLLEAKYLSYLESKLEIIVIFISSFCPHCGFMLGEFVPGLPCPHCGEPLI